jgi:hypothetical protein
MQTIAYRRKIVLGAILAVIIVSALATAAILVAPQSNPENPVPSSVGSSELIVELTDPPVVPPGTTSLNLTYSQLDLSVTEPGDSAPQALTIVPGGGSQTTDLLSLENVSQTLGLSTVPADSTVSGVTFLVSQVTMTINGTAYPVQLAEGGNSLLVSITNPATLQGSQNALLLEFNPTILRVSGEYELISSSSAILKPQSEISTSDSRIGFTQSLSVQDQQQLLKERGRLQAQVVSISVSGNQTTMSVQVTNTGDTPERLILFGIIGEFSLVCNSQSRSGHCRTGLDDVILIPGEPHNGSSSTTVSGCAPRHMSLVNPPDIRNDLHNPIVMNPGQCLTFTFSGTLKAGNHAVVPCMNGKFEVQVYATNRAGTKVDCVVQTSSVPSCSTQGN